jgi:type IV pilus assembly protein PilE
MKQKGFTLVELMITVAIIAIIAAVAYPSYVEQVRKTRRTNAQADLMELASFMERYYTNSATYKDAALPFTESPQDSGTKYYNITPTTVTTTDSYTLTATPKNGQQADRCGTMTLSNTGAKTASASDCWK